VSETEHHVPSVLFTTVIAEGVWRHT